MDILITLAKPLHGRWSQHRAMSEAIYGRHYICTSLRRAMTEDKAADDKGTKAISIAASTEAVQIEAVQKARRTLKQNTEGWTEIVPN